MAQYSWTIKNGVATIVDPNGTPVDPKIQTSVLQGVGWDFTKIPRWPAPTNSSNTSGSSIPRTSTGEIPTMESGKPIPNPIIPPHTTEQTASIAAGTAIGVPPGQTKAQVIPPTTGDTYTVKEGDTLWDLAAKFLGSGSRWKELGAQVGITTEEQAKRLQIGTVLNVSSSSLIKPTNEMVQTSDQIRDEETKKKADEEKKIAEDSLKQDQEIVDLTKKKTITELKAGLGIGEAPAKSTFASDFEALRSKEGITAVESQINNLSTQIRDTEASLRQGLYDVEGQLAPMELIGTRQRELTRQGQEQLDSLNRRKATLVDEYNTKVDLVSNIMKFKMTDYDNAVSEYNTKFNQAITMQNLLSSEEDKVNAEVNAQRDDARANVTLITNMIKDSKKTFSELDPTMQLELKKQELKAGLPTGIVEYYLSAKPDTELLTHVNSQDAAGNDITTFIYKGADGKPGAVDIVYTGGVAKATATEKPKTTIQMGDEDFVKMIQGQLNAMSAYTSGKLKIEGDLLKSQLIEKLFKF